MLFKSALIIKYYIYLIIIAFHLNLHKNKIKRIAKYILNYLEYLWSVWYRYLSNMHMVSILKCAIVSLFLSKQSVHWHVVLHICCFNFLLHSQAMIYFWSFSAAADCYCCSFSCWKVRGNTTPFGYRVASIHWNLT